MVPMTAAAPSGDAEPRAVVALSGEQTRSRIESIQPAPGYTSAHAGVGKIALRSGGPSVPLRQDSTGSDNGDARRDEWRKICHQPAAVAARTAFQSSPAHHFARRARAHHIAHSLRLTVERDEHIDRIGFRCAVRAEIGVHCASSGPLSSTARNGWSRASDSV